MGLRAATTCILVVALAFAACGRRGDPIAPQGRHLKAPPLGLSMVGRIGFDHAGFAAGTPAPEVLVEWITAENFHCGTQPLVANGSTTATTRDQLPPFVFALPATGDAYLRIIATESEPSRWVYVPPITTVPQGVTFTTSILHGQVLLESWPPYSFFVAEYLNGTWRNLGKRKAQATLGPYPPGDTVILSAHPVTDHRGGLAYAAEAVTFVVEVE